jgi:hypothetical protein
MLFSNGRLAKLRYLSGSFEVMTRGDHVLCAVTGTAIPLERLRYWSHELQEPYLDAVVASKRYAEMRSLGKI